ncbi:MAG TPA: zinc ribbon domain-containing protein, partial [Pyrinomonadaceae bacterium]
CPQCGLRQATNEARFCPSCGFHLGVVGELLPNNGQLAWRPAEPKPQGLSPRQKGVRQGAMVMLSTLLVVPLLAIFAVVILGFTGEIVALPAVGLPVGGFLRIMYALMFESNVAPGPAAAQPAYMPPPAIPNYLGTPARGAALPPQQQGAPVPAQSRPQRYNTGELVGPPRTSVTDHTTRLLDKQPHEPQGE